MGSPRPGGGRVRVVTSVTWRSTHAGDSGKGPGQGPTQSWVGELPLASGRQEDRCLGTTEGQSGAALTPAGLR